MYYIILIIKFKLCILNFVLLLAFFLKDMLMNYCFYMISLPANDRDTVYKFYKIFCLAT